LRYVDFRTPVYFGDVVVRIVAVSFRPVEVVTEGLGTEATPVPYFVVEFELQNSGDRATEYRSWAAGLEGPAPRVEDFHHNRSLPVGFGYNATVRGRAAAHSVLQPKAFMRDVLVFSLSSPRDWLWGKPGPILLDLPAEHVGGCVGAAHLAIPYTLVEGYCGDRSN
jgi:hypothetical protein